MLIIFHPAYIGINSAYRIIRPQLITLYYLNFMRICHIFRLKLNQGKGKEEFNNKQNPLISVWQTNILLKPLWIPHRGFTRFQTAIQKYIKI